MLSTAASEGGPVAWEHGEIQHWVPRQCADLIFASAVLHFLGDHETLLPRLLGYLRPGGCLALHMPDWWTTPWYSLMCEVPGPRRRGDRVRHRRLFPFSRTGRSAGSRFADRARVPGLQNAFKAGAD